jgi:HPt (histidine-containing phosphotransfer) domain-containing protein
MNMSEERIDVVISKDLEDLVPVFMSNRHKELEALKQAVATQDFEQLRHLGHRMKGVGNSYGFERVSSLGKCIEDHAKVEDVTTLGDEIASYEHYLAHLRIRYE